MPCAIRQADGTFKVRDRAPRAFDLARDNVRRGVKIDSDAATAVRSIGASVQEMGAASSERKISGADFESEPYSPGPAVVSS